MHVGYDENYMDIVVSKLVFGKKKYVPMHGTFITGQSAISAWTTKTLDSSCKDFMNPGKWKVNKDSGEQMVDKKGDKVEKHEQVPKK